MLILSLLTFVGTCFAFLMGSFIYFRRPEVELSRHFFLIMSVITFTGVSELAYRLAPDLFAAYFWIRISSLNILFFPMALLFVWLFTEKREILSRGESIFYLFSPTILFILLEIVIHNAFGNPIFARFGWTYEVFNSPIAAIALVWNVVLCVLMIFHGFQYADKMDNPRIKSQARLITIGFGLIGVSILAAKYILPVFDYNIALLPLLATDIALLIIWYAIGRHNLFSLSSESAAYQVINSIHDIIIVTSKTGRITDVNRAATEALGYTEDELKEKNISDLIFGNIEIRSNQLNDPQKNLETDSKLLGKDDKLLEVSFSMTPIFDSAGRISTMIFVGRNITEKAWVQKALLERERRYRMLFNGGNDLILVYKFEERKPGLLLEVNDIASEKLGYTKEELKSKSIMDLISDKQHRLADSYIHRLKKENRIMFEIEFVTKDERRIPYEISSRIFELNGEKLVVNIARDITERMINQEMLHVMDIAIETSINAIFTLDMTGHITYVNGAFIDLWNYSDDASILLEPITNFIFDADIMLEQIKKDGRFIGELHGICKNGYEITLQVGSSSFRHVSGKLIGIMGSCIDITERKKAQDEVYRLKEELQIIFNSVPALIFYKDLDGKILRVNRAYEDMAGHAFNGEPEYELLPIQESMEYWVDDRIIMRSGSPMRNIIEQVQSSKGPRWLKTDKIPYRNSNDEIAGVIGFSVDITELKETEKALKESQDNYRDLVEKAEIAIMIEGTNGDIQYYNNKFIELFGYLSYDFGSFRFEDIVYPEDIPNIQEYKLNRDIFSENPKRLEFRGVKKNGEIIYLQADMVPFTEDGHVVGTRYYLWDETERKSMEQELMKVQKLESLGLLAGGIAHDFNNVLTGILGNISFAKMGIEPNTRIYKRLRESEKATLRAKELTQQLLTFSKGGAPIRKTSTIDQLVEDTATFALRGTKILPVYAFNSKDAIVEIDGGQISQVINNIVINALQAMPEGGKLDISTNVKYIDTNSGLPVKPGSYVEIKITDYGIGISDENLTKIFDPYFTTKETGNGLGLATSFSIIKNHDGYMTAESSYRSGSTFRVFLPVSFKELEEHDETRICCKDGIPFAGGKILVMDDEKFVLDLVGDMLDHVGYDVVLAENGETAIKQFNEARENNEEFDLLIFDLTIPGGMGGKETIAEIRKLDPYVDAIVSSGYSNDPIMSEYKKFGFTHVVSKPYEAGELLEAVYEILSNKNGDSNERYREHRAS